MTNAELSLKASAREEVKKKVDQLRKQGKVPAVLYGHKVKPTNLAVDYSTFEKVYKKAGDSTLVDLIVDESAPVKVLIQDYQYDPVSHKFIHIDFHQVDMNEKITTEIPLKFMGVAPAVKELSGVLVTMHDTVEVRCLPGALVHEIEVDLSGMKTFDDMIHFSDITIPAGMEVLNKMDDVIAQVQAAREEEDLSAAPVTPNLPEGVAEPKAEEGAAGSDKKE